MSDIRECGSCAASYVDYCSFEKGLKEHLKFSENNEFHFYKQFKGTNHIPQQGLNILHLNKESQTLNLLETLEINTLKKE